MKTTLNFAAVAVAVAALTPAVATASPLRNAVVKYYAANDQVQLAVFLDVCENDGLLDSTATRDRWLSGRDSVSYDKIRFRLGKAYEAEKIPTDSRLEQIKKDFCKAADSR